MPVKYALILANTSFNKLTQVKIQSFLDNASKKQILVTQFPFEK
jgi:hypothetical protein